jgi:hypothetical protein
MDLNHKPSEQLYLASFGQIFMIKTKLSKFSIPSQHYLKLVMTCYHHYKKSWFFLIGKINWKGHILHIWWLDQGVILDMSIWTRLFWLVVKMDMFQIDYWSFFTNTSSYILTSQFVQLSIWLIIKWQSICMVFIHHMSLFHKTTIAKCQTRCARLMTHVNILGNLLATCPNLMWKS